MFDLLGDKEIAEKVKLTTSWVRKQRLMRRQGKKHSFTVDPVMVGNVPRYRQEEVQSWIEMLPDGRGPGPWRRRDGFMMIKSEAKP